MTTLPHLFHIVFMITFHFGINFLCSVGHEISQTLQEPEQVRPTPSTSHYHMSVGLLDSLLECWAFSLNVGPGASVLFRVHYLGYKLLYTVFRLRMLLLSEDGN